MPGTRLELLLHWINLKPCPGCHDHAEMMDKNGPEWCLENLDTIVGWLEESAKNQGAFFWRPGARWLVRLAIAQARRGSTEILETDLDSDTPEHIKEQWRLDKEQENVTMSHKEL